MAQITYVKPNGTEIEVADNAANREYAERAGWKRPGEEPAANSGDGDQGQNSPAPVTHTEQSLKAVADAEGMDGLRKIAEPLGVKGTSKDGLIADILAAQAPQE